MKYTANTYKAVEGQLESVDKALDVVMIVTHVLNHTEEPSGNLTVDAGALASALSLAYCTISDVIDAIRESPLEKEEDEV